MMDGRVSSRYARALLGLAMERGELAVVDQSLIRVTDILNQCPEIMHLVLNSTISQSEKEDFLGKILSKDMPVLVQNFLKLLIKKRRFQDFNGIQQEFHRLVEKQNGILEVEAISPRPLSPEAGKKIIEQLNRKLKLEIKLNTTINEKLIGGLILRFGGNEIDASFRTSLEEIKRSLTVSSLLGRELI